MKEQTNQERLSIRTASKALGVSEKSITRYIERGILKRVKDGHRVYLLSDEVRKLRKKRQTESKYKIGQEIKPTITIPVETYNSLLTELTDIRARSNYLIEYKHINEKLTRELNQAREEIFETTTWIKEIIQESKETAREKKNIENQTQEKISHLEEQNKHLTSSSIFTIQKKDDELKEMRRKLTDLQRELTRVKKRGFFKRIFNK